MGVAGGLNRTDPSSTAYSGGFAAAGLGKMLRPSMAIGTRSIGGSDDGVKAGVREAVSVTLAEIMADNGHYSIDSTTVRAHVSAVGGKGGLVEELLAARGAGSPVSFTVWLIDLPERTPKAFLADKGYDADAIRADLANRNIEAVIPGRSNRRVKIKYDRSLYKERNQIERFFGRLKINRAIATRYDQLAESFLSMVHIASARYWLKFVHAA